MHVCPSKLLFAQAGRHRAHGRHVPTHTPAKRPPRAPSHRGWTPWLHPASPHSCGRGAGRGAPCCEVTWKGGAQVPVLGKDSAPASFPSGSPEQPARCPAQIWGQSLLPAASGASSRGPCETPSSDPAKPQQGCSRSLPQLPAALGQHRPCPVYSLAQEKDRDKAQKGVPPRGFGVVFFFSAVFDLLQAGKAEKSPAQPAPRLRGFLFDCAKASGSCGVKLAMGSHQQEKSKRKAKPSLELPKAPPEEPRLLQGCCHRAPRSRALLFSWLQ